MKSPKKNSQRTKSELREALVLEDISEEPMICLTVKFKDKIPLLLREFLTLWRMQLSLLSSLSTELSVFISLIKSKTSPLLMNTNHWKKDLTISNSQEKSLCLVLLLVKFLLTPRTSVIKSLFLIAKFKNTVKEN